jgi:hypothetical protein
MQGITVKAFLIRAGIGRQCGVLEMMMLNRDNRFRVLVVFLISIFFLSSGAIASDCSSKEIEDNKKQWGVDSQQLFVFTQKIVDAYYSRDLKELERYFRSGELLVGPRRSRLQNSDFSDVFSDAARRSVIETGATCNIFNAQGALLGGGVWVSTVNEMLVIISITDFIPEPFNDGASATAILVKGAALPPSCLIYPWRSTDNFEAMSKHYGIPLADLLKNPGHYVSAKTSEYFTPSWCEGESAAGLPCKEGLALSVSLERCASLYVAPKQEKNKVISSEKDPIVDSYTILAEVPPQKCMSLSEGSDVKVGKCYALQLEAARYTNFSVHALFSNGTIAPLVVFDSKNELRDQLQP